MRGHVSLIALLTLGFAPASADADGGTVRYAGVHAGRRITVFTTPTLLQAGHVDVSILVQHADTAKPLVEVPIVVSAYPIGAPARKSSVPATTEAATNKLLHAASLHLAEAGAWRIEVAVDDAAPIGFDLEVAPGPPAWLDMGLWIGWPLLAIIVFAVHQWLVQRRTGSR